MSIGAWLVWLGAVIGLLSLFAAVVSMEILAVGLLCGALVLAALFGVQAAWALRHYREPAKALSGQKTAPPTVTIAIPARNETHALTRCLEAALVSDYPRLEIIVLDDCSQDNTSHLIRSFAHSGVRFVQGEAPSDGWLGKNNAFRVLEKEATGEYIFFMGVDTHLGPAAITQALAYAKTHKAGMVSILPYQRSQFLGPLLMHHLRYVWQIILPLGRDHVPVSAESWLVKRSSLQGAGGFTAWKDVIVPEASAARYFAARGQYRFLIANGTLDISYGKKWTSQLETNTRLWYPSVRKQPLLAISLSACMLLFGLGPFVAPLVVKNSFIFGLSIVVCAIYVMTYAIVLRQLQPRLWWLSLWLLPLHLLQEAVTIVLSMTKYEFTDVHWKGRNICYPHIPRVSR